MIEINNQGGIKINEDKIKKISRDFLKYYKKDKKVSVAFVDDKVIKGLNRQYRGINKVTDVLSFPEEEKNFLGEIIIDSEQIKRQARGKNNSFSYELYFILVHGLLHLLGYNDKTEKERKKMLKLGEEFLKKEGVKNRKL